MGKFFTPVCICRLLLHFPLWPILSKMIKKVFSKLALSVAQTSILQRSDFCKSFRFIRGLRMKNIFIFIGRNLSKKVIVVFQESFFSFPSFVQFACQHRVLSCVLGAAYFYTRILLASKLEKVAFSTGLPNPLWPIKNLRKRFNFPTEPHCTL